MKKGLFVIVFIISCAFADAQSGYVFSAISPNGQRLYYDTILGGARVVSHDYSYAGNLIIPDSVTDPTTNQTYPVTQIKTSAFFSCAQLTTITIPSTIRNIGQNAFRYCSSLTTIYYNADSCGSAYMPFQECPNISSLVIGNSVRYIPSNIFRGISSLTSVMIPDSVAEIGNSAFNACLGITTLTIGRGVCKIGTSAFGSPQLSTIYFNADSCECAINWLNSQLSQTIPNVVLGDNVRYLPSSMFYNNTAITSYTIPPSVKWIGGRAFYGCTNLSNITIHDSVQFIGTSAFSGCSGLTSITIPESIDSIGDNAFQNCTSLTEVFYSGSLENWCNIGFGNHLANPIFQTKGLHINNVLVSNINQNSSISRIKPFAFCGDTCIESISFPESIYIIEKDAFSQCLNVSSISFPSETITIGENAFRHCSNVSNIIFPTGTIIIGENAFSECVGITSINITSSTAFIGDSAFSGCSGLNALIIQGSIIGSYAFYGCTGLSQVTIGDSVTTIGDYSFSNCSGISSILFSSKHTNIGRYAFSNCSGLTSVSIQGNNIGNNAFRGCDGIYHISIGDSVISVGDSAFWGCSNLDSIFIGNSVESFGAYAFNGCENILKTNYNGTIKKWCSIYFANENANPIFYSHNLFCNNTPVFEINVNDSINHINRNAFINDTLLSKVQATGSITKIGYQAFYGCANIDTLILGRQIDTLMGAAFCYCSNLRYIKLYTHIPPTLMSSVFYNISNYARFYTPCNSTASYTSAWGNGYDFRNWDPPLEFSITVSSGSPSFYGSASVYETNPCTSTAIITATAQPHYYFSQWNDGVTTNPRTIVLEQDTSFVATFGKCSYTITCHSGNATMGSVSGGGTLEYLDTVSIYATANTGFHFTHWQDNDTNSHRTITVTSNKTYTAYFDYTQYSLSVNTTNPTYGTVTGGGNYHYNTTHSIGANANYGYHFTMWSDGNTSNPRTITLTQDTVFTAIFAKNQYSLTLQSNDATHGSVSGGGVFDYLDTVTISATSVEHYHFVHWSDGNTDNPRQYIVTDNAVIVATFAIDTHIVSVAVDDISHGNVYGGGSFEYGQSCTLSATAYSGFQFVRWSNGMTYNPYTFAVLDSVNLVAEFRAVATITATSNDPTMGVVTGGGVYGIGENVVLSANAFNGYHFDHWNDGSTQNPRSFTADSSITIIAFFAQNTQTYTVTLLVNDYSMGTVTGEGQYEQGSTVTCAAVPYNGYHFDHWSDGDTQNPRIITVNSDITLTAYFAANAGIDDIDDAGINVYAKDYQIHIDEAIGKPVTIYTIDGRTVASLPKATEHVAIPVTTTGVYIVKIGAHPARKAVVIR